MHRRAIILGVVAGMAAACSRQPEEAGESVSGAPAPAAPPRVDPAETIRALYQPYLSQDAAIPELRALPWSARLRGELDAMTARAAARNEPILDFDPVVDAQD